LMRNGECWAKIVSQVSSSVWPNGRSSK
jgi:hypothetical protein